MAPRKPGMGSWTSKDSPLGVVEVAIVVWIGKVGCKGYGRGRLCVWVWVGDCERACACVCGRGSLCVCECRQACSRRLRPIGVGRRAGEQAGAKLKAGGC